MKKVLITVLVLAFLLFASACSNEPTVQNSSLEQSSELIESKTPELTNKVETSSKANVTSSKPAVTSRETTTTSKPKPATSSEKVSTSSKKVWIPGDLVIESKPIIPYSSKPDNGGTSKYMFAEELCNDPELKAQIEQLNEAYEELGMHISLEGNEEKLTIVYKFLTQMDAATLKEPLEEALKAQKETFNLQVAQLQTEVMTKMVLGIKYVNADGTVICEAEYPQ